MKSLAALVVVVAACGGDTKTPDAPVHDSTVVDTAPPIDAPPPTVFEVNPCPSNIAQLVTATANIPYQYQPSASAIHVNDVVQFMMPANHNVVPNAVMGDTGLNVGFGQTKCLQFSRHVRLPLLGAPVQRRGQRQLVTAARTARRARASRAPRHGICARPVTDSNTRLRLRAALRERRRAADALRRRRPARRCGRAGLHGDRRGAICIARWCPDSSPPGCGWWRGPVGFGRSDKPVARDDYTFRATSTGWRAFSTRGGCATSRCSVRTGVD